MLHVRLLEEDIQLHTSAAEHKDSVYLHVSVIIFQNNNYKYEMSSNY